MKQTVVVNPRVFISYAHESEEHRLAVKSLADWLVEHGVKAITDHPYEYRAPEMGWLAWMLQAIEDADVVLVICSPRLKARYEKREDPNLGFGATYEGAIVTQLIYDSAQRNTKFFPILPDEGDREAIPLTLRSFENNHRFPSGNDRILRLVTDEVVVPKPRRPLESLPPGALRGARDNRLEPQEVEVYGREFEIAVVLEFLRGADPDPLVCAQVVGTAGVGKTEICKAALKRWLVEAPQERVYFVDIPDRAAADELVYRIGTALGSENVLGFVDLQPRLRDGLYYLDNLESVAETPEGQRVLRQLRDQPGVRLLISSRVSLQGLGRTIVVGPLLTEPAVQLFRDLWTGERRLEYTDALRRFVALELGNHALSISLTARLGDSYGFPALVQRWKALGTTLAVDILRADSRHGSLTVSLALTAESLSAQPGALLLWTLAAVFPDGMPEPTLTAFEQTASLPDSARQRLSRHHVWIFRNGRFVLLPPVARYAIDEASMERGGFSWREAGSHGFGYFGALLFVAAERKPSNQSSGARDLVLEQFGAIARLVETEARQASPRRDFLDDAHMRLLQDYQFCASQARELLRCLIPVLSNPFSAMLELGHLEQRLGHLEEARHLLEQSLARSQSEGSVRGRAIALRALGDLENRMGHLEEGRRLHEQALSLFQETQHGLGQANTLFSLGELERRLGHLKEASNLYAQALQLFQNEQDRLGQANTLRSLGDLEFGQGNVDEARQLYEQALLLYARERDGLGQANTLRSLGDLKIRMGHLDDAWHFHIQALQLFQSEEAYLGQANTLQSLGYLKRLLGHLEEARTLYQKAISLLQEEHDAVERAATLRSLGDLESSLGRLEEARRLYDQALQLFQVGDDSFEQSNTLRTLGDLELEAGNINAALT